MHVPSEASEVVAAPRATFVLIPGAGGDAWYWHLLEPELRRLGHDVISVDLPADDDSADLTAYADVVVDAIGSRSGVVLVAQSMDGFTAPLVSDRVSAACLVFLNAMIPSSGERAGDWWGVVAQAEAMQANNVREGRPADAEFDLMTYFFHDVPRSLPTSPSPAGAASPTLRSARPAPLGYGPTCPSRSSPGATIDSSHSSFNAESLQNA